MDHTTVDLLSAIDFLLRQAKQGERWMFEEGSEIHLVLAEANTQARIALGIDRPATRAHPGGATPDTA